MPAGPPTSFLFEAGRRPRGHVIVALRRPFYSGARLWSKRRPQIVAARTTSTLIHHLHVYRNPARRCWGSGMGTLARATPRTATQPACNTSLSARSSASVRVRSASCLSGNCRARVRPEVFQKRQRKRERERDVNGCRAKASGHNGSGHFTNFLKISGHIQKHLSTFSQKSPTCFRTFHDISENSRTYPDIS